MTACLILATFLGTSAAQAKAAEDSLKQRPLAIRKAVCQLDPTTVQQQFKEGASTSGSKNPKELGKRGISESTSEHGTHSCFVSGTYSLRHRKCGVRGFIIQLHFVEYK